MCLSSEDYTEPDVVVNFGNVCEMIFWFQTYTPDKDQILSEISYSNMTHRTGVISLVHLNSLSSGT